MMIATSSWLRLNGQTKGLCAADVATQLTIMGAHHIQEDATSANTTKV
jgi:hypothetical protein